MKCKKEKRKSCCFFFLKYGTLKQKGNFYSLQVALAYCTQPLERTRYCCKGTLHTSTQANTHSALICHKMRDNTLEGWRAGWNNRGLQVDYLMRPMIGFSEETNIKEERQMENLTEK